MRTLAAVEVLDRSSWELVFDEAFLDSELDDAKWVAHYLPQWSDPHRSAARYDVGGGILRLRIDAHQPPWRDEDGQLRVSNLQTATFAGPVGSDRGTHRHRADLRVRTAVPHRQLFTLTSGLVEARVCGPEDRACMLAVWLVGVEDESPRHAGEICIAELYGHAVGAEASTVRLGIKAHHDPRLTDDMADLRLDIDTTDWHTYAAAWSEHEARFYVDDQLVRVVPQGIGYPLQLMVDLFEFPQDNHRDPRGYPKTADVAAVRGYRPGQRL